MINWDLLNFRNILTIAALAIVGLFVFNHFAKRKEESQ